jgi:hypothetical protein
MLPPRSDGGHFDGGRLDGTPVELPPQDGGRLPLQVAGAPNPPPAFAALRAPARVAPCFDAPLSLESMASYEAFQRCRGPCSHRACQPGWPDAARGAARGEAGNGAGRTRRRSAIEPRRAARRSVRRAAPCACQHSALPLDDAWTHS